MKFNHLTIGTDNKVWDTTKILSSDEEDIQDRDNGRCQRLPPDDQTDGGCYFADVRV